MTNGAEIFQIPPYHAVAEVLKTPNVETTRAQLDKILHSRTFKRAKRLRSLLHYVVTAATNGQTTGESKTARELFGKGDDFDPSLDPVIRVQFGRLRRALDTYYSTEGQRDSVLIEIPNRKYTPVFQESADGTTVRSLDPRPKGQLDVIELDPQDHVNGGGRGPNSRAVIAVLPFANLTSDPAHDNFCFGLTEEITNGLAAASSVDVVASTSTFHYRRENVDIREVGQELGVPLVLEGSVRMEDGNTRVIAQLARSRDGVAVWSGSFDAKLNGSLDTQKSLAQQVITTLPLSEAEVQ